MSAVIAKARRFVTEGRVENVPTARVFSVQGDTASYVVTVVGENAHCTCPASLVCSHALAASYEAAQMDAHLGSSVIAHIPAFCGTCEEPLEDGRCPHRGRELTANDLGVTA